MTKLPLVVDADGHVEEPNAMWREYVAPAYRDRAPRTEVEPDGYPRLIIDGRKAQKIPRPAGYTAKPRRKLLGGHDPRARLQDMDTDGIDIAVLFGTKALIFGGLADSALAVELSRAYHNWLADYRSVEPRRLKGVGVLPLQDIEASVHEAQRVVGELKMCGVMVRPNPYHGRRLDDPLYDVLWSAIAELGVPLAIHEGTNMNMPSAGAERFDDFFFQHIASHVLEQQIAMLSLICGGVLARHPGLRVAFLESGAGWVPFWLERMDHHVEKMGWMVPHLEEHPSDYFRRQCWVGVDCDEKRLGPLHAWLGEDRLMFASDYPHADALFPGSVAAVQAREDLSDTAKVKVLGQNASRFYGVH